MNVSRQTLPRWEFSFSSPPSPIAAINPVGDLNQDGYSDLAVLIQGIGDASDRVAIVYGYPRPEGDALVMDLSQPSPLDRLGRPRYELYTPGSGDQERRFRLIGDVNGDGRQDVAVVQPAFPGRENYVLFSPPGGLTVANLLADPGALDGRTGFYLPGPTVADFAGDGNGDGLADLAVNTAAGGLVIWGRRQGFPGRIEPEELDGSNGFRIPGHTVVGGGGDLNGDGRSEIFLRSGSSNSILFSQSRYPAVVDSGRLTPVISPSAIAPPVLSYLADLNRDGRDELVVVEGLSSSSVGQKSHVFYGRTNWPSAIELAQADFFQWGAVQGRFDFNGDGWLDLLAHSFPLPPCARCLRVTDSWLTLGQPEGWRSPTALPGPDNTLGRTTGTHNGAQNLGDFNGDGRVDVWVFDDKENKVLFGGSPWPEANGVIVNTPNSFALRPVGDVNGDGLADLAGANYVFLGQGDRPPLTVNGGVYHHFAFPQFGATPYDRLLFNARSGEPDWGYGGWGNDTLVGASGHMDQFTGGPGADRFVLNNAYGFQVGQGFAVIWDFEKGRDKVVVNGSPEDYFFVSDTSSWLDNRNAPFLQHRGSDTSALPNTLLARRQAEGGAVMIATFSDVSLDRFDLIYI